MTMERSKISKIDARKTDAPSFLSEDRVFVLFYASWCQFSQRFLPIFNKFEEIVTDKCARIVIDENHELREKYQIKVVPTILFIEKGQVKRRLDGKAGKGLNEQNLLDFSKQC